MYEFIKEKEIEKIVLEHVVNSKLAQDRSKELIKRVFEQVIARVLLQVKLYVENSNHFKTTERVYDEVKQLNDKYVKYLSEHDPEEIPREDEREVLQGVMRSISNALDEFPDHDENPLVYERMLLISTGLLKIKEQMNKLKEEVLFAFSLPVSIHNDFTKLIKDHLLVSYERIYSVLQDLVDEVVGDLNDKEQRPELLNYLSFVENQENLLKGFIYINLEIGEGWQEENEANELSAKYIYPLRQLYQEFHTINSDINHVLRKKHNINKLEIKNVEKIIEANILSDKKLKDLMELVEDDKNNTIDVILIHMNDELTKASKKEMIKIKKVSSRFELLSCFEIQLFEEALGKLTLIDIEAINDNTEQLIAKGIFDSLYLKYDSLKEKDQDYHMKKKEDFLTYGENFLAFKSEFESKCETFLEESIQGSNEGFYKAQERFIKLMNKEQDDNLSSDLKYLKEDILFELTTFEDMLNQSVFKLSNSQSDVSTAFAAIVNKLYETIVNQLKCNEILPLIPKAESMFNGKLHEIVITDIEEGFTKGQIIRTQNCGYIFENRVLRRASVIVSK